jgi:hypothetical protein
MKNPQVHVQRIVEAGPSLEGLPAAYGYVSIVV